MSSEVGSREELREKVKEISALKEEGKNFLNKYDGPSRRVRKSQLKKYLVFRDRNCEELIDETEEDWEKSRRERDFVAEHHLRKFEKWLADLGFSEHTIANHLAAVRAFYKFNNFPLKDDKLSSRNPSSKPENKPIPISKEKVKKVYNSTSSSRNRALILFLYQTGQGANEVSKLNYGDVKAELEKKKYPLKISYSGRKGTGFSYCTFLGADGIEALKRYLDDRREKLGLDPLKGEDLNPEAPLFAKRNGKDRLSGEAIAEILKYIARKAPEAVITEGEMERADLNPLRPHAFRKNFKTTLVPVANNFAIEYMMGHQLNKVERSYWVDRMGGQEGLREYYAEVMEPELSIDVESTDAQVAVSEEVESEFKEKIKEKLGEDIIFKEDHEAEIETLKSKYLETRSEANKLKKKVEEQGESLKNLQEEKKSLNNDFQEQGEKVKRLSKMYRGLLEDEICRRVVELVKEGKEIGVDFQWLKKWATQAEQEAISKIEKYSKSESVELPSFPELPIDKLNDLRRQLLFLYYEVHSRKAKGKPLENS